MASAENYEYNFPYFPPPQNSHSPPKFPHPPNKPSPKPPPPKFPVPAPPPHHPISPPPPAAKPPSHLTPPPPSHPNYPPPPSHPNYPPPPFHPIYPPPPPHIVPTPSPPGHHPHAVIVVIFVSLGGLFFLAFLSVALCCFIKKRRKSVQETDIVKIDEHLKIKEVIIEGQHGPQTVTLSVEDDIHIQEEIRKNESSVGKGGGSHVTLLQTHPQVLDIEPSTSGGSRHHHLDQNTT